VTPAGVVIIGGPLPPAAVVCNGLFYAGFNLGGGCALILGGCFA